MDDFSSFARSAHTLPRNFTWHYQDGELPKTPEPSESLFLQRTSPPPAPAGRIAREPYRLRRRRAPFQAAQRVIRAVNRENSFDSQHSDGHSQENQDIPVPSIELTDSAGAPIETEGDSLAARMYAPPRTPIAQIYGPEENVNREASSSQEDLTRPSTACSGFSDSSKSSSVESFPSFGESCSSPKSQHDPFLAAPSHGLASSPLLEYGMPTFHSCPGSNATRQPFTTEMDDHLWQTYMRYLQDPRHTPFKMLPGTAPPLGVCSKVVREAKRTWKGYLTSTIPKVYRFARWGSNRSQTPDANACNGQMDRRPLVPWPRSDSATRRRLRELCKLKPTLSAHYGRLLHARSPSPFMSSSVAGRSSSVANQQAISAFSTRDMNISLATSVATTMQPAHPLAQLSCEAAMESQQTPVAPIPRIVRPQETSTPRPRATTQELMNQMQGPPRTPNHQKSLSMQDASLSTHPRPLASPFRPQLVKIHSFEPSQAKAGPSNAPTLAPPAELHAPIPRRTLFKRPAQNELNDMMHSEDPYTRQHQLLKELFGNQPIEVSHRRVRSRGFSLGDMTAASRLESLFSTPKEPQLASDNNLSSMPRFSSNASTTSLLPPPSIEGVARLGSPFAEKPAPKTHFNTFPRNFSLIGLEPAMDIAEDAGEPSDPLPPLPGLGQS